MNKEKRNRSPYLKVKAYFVEKEIHQKEVAALLEVTPNTMTKKLNGFGGDFTLGQVKRMNKHFGVPIAYFFELEVPIKEQVS